MDVSDFGGQAPPPGGSWEAELWSGCRRHPGRKPCPLLFQLTAALTGTQDQSCSHALKGLTRDLLASEAEYAFSTRVLASCGFSCILI